MPSLHHIAILASGSGTNAEAIMKYFQDHSAIQVKLVLTNKPDALVIQRATKHRIPFITFTREQFQKEEWLSQKLKEHGITHLVLAGFLWLIPSYLVNSFPGRIINIHPALLPKFGGKGMYGMKVHQAVKEAGEKQSGITIHLVNEHYDEGDILYQVSCELQSMDSAEEIARKVQHLEHQHYPIVIENWIQGYQPEA